MLHKPFIYSVLIHIASRTFKPLIGKGFTMKHLRRVDDILLDFEVLENHLPPEKLHHYGLHHFKKRALRPFSIMGRVLLFAAKLLLQHGEASLPLL